MKSFRSKLAMCALVVGSFVGVADAGQVIVFEALDHWNQRISANFAVNRELGRAWIDVQVHLNDSVADEGQDLEVISKAVEGLYYDSARKQVLYRTATETIVCAEDATFLWGIYLKSTGKCLLTPRTEHRKVDDGFEIRDRTVAKIVFEAHTSTTSQQAAASKTMFRETGVWQMKPRCQLPPP
jgi:hypothetical protein